MDFLRKMEACNYIFVPKLAYETSPVDNMFKNNSKNCNTIRKMLPS